MSFNLITRLTVTLGYVRKADLHDRSFQLLTNYAITSSGISYCTWYTLEYKQNASRITRKCVMLRLLLYSFINLVFIYTLLYDVVFCRKYCWFSVDGFFFKFVASPFDQIRGHNTKVFFSVVCVSGKVEATSWFTQCGEGCYFIASDGVWCPSFALLSEALKWFLLELK